MIEKKLIDGVIEEPLGGAHTDVKGAVVGVKKAILDNYKQLKKVPVDKLRSQRIDKFVAMGVVNQ